MVQRLKTNKAVKLANKESEINISKDERKREASEPLYLIRYE